jgi:tetratricopeptide (TPR) repeat protein
VEAATAALAAGEREQAEQLSGRCSPSMARIGALCGLALLALKADRPTDAMRLLDHAQRQSPHVPVVWRTPAQVLIALGQLEEASAAGRYLTTIEPDSAQSWITLAAAAARALRQEDALVAYRQAAELRPDEVRLQTSLGHVYKALGQRVASEAAYHAALALQADDAEAWWSLADLKNYHFTDAECDHLAQFSPGRHPVPAKPSWRLRTARRWSSGRYGRRVRRLRARQCTPPT